VIAAHFDVGRVEPDIGSIAFERSVEKGFDRSSISSHNRDTRLLGDAGTAHGLRDRRRTGSRRRGRKHPGSRRSAPSRPPPRLQEARKIRTLRSLGMRSSTVPASSPSHGRDSRCDGPTARANARHEPRRSWLPPPAPSTARPRSRSCRAEYRRRRSSHEREGSPSRWGFLGCVETRKPTLPENRR
jgi:hypothetical protein